MTLMNKIGWSLKHPIKSAEIQLNRIRARLCKKEKVLFYVGMNTGHSFDTIFRAYEHCYGFEANPESFQKLKKRYENHPNVTLIHAAVSDQNGTAEFNISDDTNAGASSLGKFNPDWNQQRKTPINIVKTVAVPTINLAHFCKQNGIEYISDYISDIQGMDFTVLETLTPMIENKAIGSITCEVSKNGKKIYNGLPSNTLSSFESLLNSNYDLVATGTTGALKDQHFDEVPDSWWEMDCKWRVKKTDT